MDAEMNGNEAGNAKDSSNSSNAEPDASSFMDVENDRITSKPDSSGNEFDFFALPPPKKKQKAKRPGKEKKTKFSIHIASVQNKEEEGKRKSDDDFQEGKNNAFDDLFGWDNDASYDDWLEFFAETHEDQDPAFIARQNQKREEALKKEIATLDEKDMAVRSEIDKVVDDLLKEKQSAMERKIESYRERIRQDENKLAKRLLERYNERKASNEQKINQRLKQLQVEQQKQMAMTLQQHRQQAQQRRLPDAMAAQEWQMTSQRLQAKHQQQHQELVKRTEEYKRRTDMEYKQEQEKIKKVHQQKMSDLESRRNEIIAELVKQFTSSRQRYLKRHLQRVMKEKEQLTSQLDEEKDPKDSADSKDGRKSAVDAVKNDVENKQELRPPSPYKSIPDWIDPNQESSVGALTRHKHRKGVLSPTQTSSQLSIEIHNEGLWILRLINNPAAKAKATTSNNSQNNTSGGSAQSPNNNNDNENSTEESGQNSAPTNRETTVEPEFLPWGMRAFEILETVVRGEVPMGELDLGDLAIMTHTAGQVFCSITDLRTSEETAAFHRAISLKEYEASIIADLEKKAAELAKTTKEHELAIAKLEKEEKQFSVAVDSAIKDQDKAKKLTDDFIRRYRQCIGPDGRVLPKISTKDRDEMETKLMRYKNNFATAEEKVKTAKDRLSEKKSKLQDLQAKLKTTQRSADLIVNTVKRRKSMTPSTAQSSGAKSHYSDGMESEYTANRIKDVMGCLEKVAEKRREEHHQKKTGQITSKWLHSNNDLPASFKKSVWRKMHRRKIQVVLRPSMASLWEGLRSKLEPSFGENHESDDCYTEKLINSEKAFLQACHPLTDSSISSIPTSKSTEAWAEPGWRLDLSVPNENEQQRGILPRAQKFPLLERNLSEITSAPGQQAASFLSTANFRSLASPLSTMAIMSSPAEIPTVFESKTTTEDSEGDPFYTTEARLKMGYIFNTKPASQKTSSNASRRKTPPKEETEKSAATKTQTSTTNEKATVSSNEKPEKKRRNQKASSDPSPRKRKKTETTTAKKTNEPTSTTTTQPNRKSSTPAQSRSRQKQAQAQAQPQKLPIQNNNSGQQGNFPSPHQHQQQMAQLRMMPPGRPGQAPPGPTGYHPAPGMQQMQQYYAPMGHQGGPSPRAQQFHSSMPPNIARMPTTGGNRQQQPGAMPMHQGLTIPGNGQPNIPMGGRPMGAPPNQNMGSMGGSGTPQARGRNAPLNGPPPGSTGSQHTTQNKQDGSAASKQDQTDPLFMLK